MKILLDEMFPPAAADLLREHHGHEAAPGGGQAGDLAAVVAAWADAHPDPYLGPHWPS